MGYPACDHRYTKTLFLGESDLSSDFGYDPPGAFGDYVWRDTDGDGIVDPGEQPMSNVVLYLCDSSVPCTSSSGDFVDSAITDNDGYYYFADLPNQSYSLTIAKPVGYSLTRYGAAAHITLIMSGDTISSIAGTPCGNCSMDVDFGLKEAGANVLEGTICVDDGSNDGVCDGTVGEDYLDGITVNLYRKTGSAYDLFSIQSTDASGNYSFTGLPSDTFIVAVGKNQPFIRISTLTTTDADAPAGSIVETGASVFQDNLILTGSTTISDIDFAFELADLDFGDLPNSYGVELNDGGPYHVMNNSWKLGSLIDAETDGTASTWADADDNSNTDDDDGISFTDAGLWKVGEEACVEATYSIPSGKTAYLAGWIDWGQDGNFIGDYVGSSELLSAGSPVQLCFTVPDDVTLDQTVHFARFRLFSDEQQLVEFAFSGGPQGDSLYGEVEDYGLKLMKFAPVSDFGDLPASYGRAGSIYRDSNENNIPDQAGAVWLGQLVSNELEQKYSALASGDGLGDDGIIFPAVLDTAGKGANTFRVIVNANEPQDVYFRFWIDWDSDGDFDSTYAGIATAASPDTTNVTVYVPDYYSGTFALRLRGLDTSISTDADTGILDNGETEDYIGYITPLPVELISFEARKAGPAIALLQWKTASEQNNDRFEIERMRSEEPIFRQIGVVLGAGNSNSIRVYEYPDLLETIPHGPVYYRLKQVDFNGAYSYSPVRVVEFSTAHTEDLLIYPNPATSHLYIELGSWQAVRELILSNMLGVQLRSEVVEPGEKIMELSLLHLPAGVYFISIADDFEKRTYRVLKQSH